MSARAAPEAPAAAGILVRPGGRHRQAVHADLHQAGLPWLDNLPKTGGVVFVTNHISHFDPFALGHTSGSAGRVPRLLGKASLFKIPMVGRIITSAGQIPVYRDSAEAADAFREAVDAVEKGECVGVYPEGTITRDPDVLADDRQDRRGPDRADHRLPGDPDREVGSAGGVRARTGPADPAAAAQDDAGDRRRTGRPERVPGQADHQRAVAQGNRSDHARGRRPARRLRGETPPAELYDPRKHKAMEDDREDGESR